MVYPGAKNIKTHLSKMSLIGIGNIADAMMLAGMYSHQVDVLSVMTQMRNSNKQNNYPHTNIQQQNHEAIQRQVREEFQRQVQKNIQRHQQQQQQEKLHKEHQKQEKQVEWCWQQLKDCVKEHSAPLEEKYLWDDYRSDLWEPLQPTPPSPSIDDFIEIRDEDSFDEDFLSIAQDKVFSQCTCDSCLESNMNIDELADCADIAYSDYEQAVAALPVLGKTNLTDSECSESD